MTLDPFRNYDAWVTREPDYMTDTATADAWYEWADNNDVPEEAHNANHPQHDIYEMWEKLFIAVDLFHEQQEQEAINAAMADADAEWDETWTRRQLDEAHDDAPESSAANLVEHDPMCGREPDGSCGLSCKCWCHDREATCA